MSNLREIVPKEYDKKKIREFLKEKLGLSSRLIKGASIDKRIFVDGKAVKMNYVLNLGEKIEVDLCKNESQDFNAEKMDLNIVYEDEDILVLNKEPFMVVHPTKRHQSGTLANGILYYFKETNQNCIVRLVSRLDMNTSGLIIIGKNQYAHMALSKEMRGENFKKRYLAIVHGNLKEKEGTINAPIYRVGEGTLKRIIDPRGQESITHYKVLESFKDGDLVECLLETGRTHQIRVHLSHLGHPIFGDSLYGTEDEEYIKRQALHAYGLDFESPRTKKKLSLRADIPKDMKNLIEKLK
ncbi:RluA family pseudouridine synthase [Clostridium fallax]|uniref:Pseudouridine synthase n=1 Tax=Clostridium fallax TaxID=1533 RepID=A0A1M4V9P9_9CLOT|nr:RluA family pseudouridine synthase [Clostridium fallax]SHE65685.1 23S rRNA pseudouridine1911/1915/1917 synthase [Clostridium fallax]SQB05825.1 RluA family pseudouridine synthase [Clostridium fallax]